jgi:hypothetical protein
MWGIAKACTGKPQVSGGLERKSLFKLWIFTVNRPQKSRFSGSFGILNRL